MRRQERAVTDPERIDAFLAQAQILRIAFRDGNEIYIVPVNFGFCYEEGERVFYFHGARAGRKYRLAGAAPEVGFETDGEYRLLPAETACGHSAEYRSVIGTGKVCLVEDPEEKRAGLQCLMKQATGKADWHYDSSSLAAVAVFRLTVGQLSCKARSAGEGHPL